MTVTNPQADTGEIMRALDLLHAPGSVAELRCPKTKKGTISGYYDDPAAMASRATALSGTVPGVYVTLNPVNPESAGPLCESHRRLRQVHNHRRKRYVPPVVALGL